MFDDGIEKICPYCGSELELDVQIDNTYSVSCINCNYVRDITKDEIDKLEN